MSMDEARAILGDEVTDRLIAGALAAPPTDPEVRARVVRRVLAAEAAITPARPDHRAA